MSEAGKRGHSIPQGLVVDFDIHDDGLTPKVYERYGELRRTCPVAWSNSHGGHWVLTRYADIYEINRCPALFSNNPVGIPPNLGQDQPLIPLEIDPPEHTSYRHILTPLFSPSRMNALEPLLRTERAASRRIIVKFLDENSRLFGAYGLQSAGRSSNRACNGLSPTPSAPK